jgi:hypothetical protein
LLKVTSLFPVATKGDDSLPEPTFLTRPYNNHVF